MLFRPISLVDFLDLALMKNGKLQIMAFLRQRIVVAIQRRKKCYHVTCNTKSLATISRGEGQLENIGKEVWMSYELWMP